MSDYAIGDIQGCYDALMRLLEHVDYDDKVDKLWFVGDLVNRGPESLAVLRFIKQLAIRPNVTLGNHDLHLLSALFGGRPWREKDDTFQEVIEAEDADELGHWLRQQAVLIHDERLDIVMCHAGIAPMWDLDKAKQLALELETVLKGPNYSHFLEKMYGNKPDLWDDKLTGIDRLRAITNYYTRMRICDSNGRLAFYYSGTVAHIPKPYYPWYAVPNRVEIEPHLVFGHWAALLGHCPHERIHAIDTGCLWGGQLTALRLQDMQRFSVPG